jgi:hypothetical protein
VYQAIQDIKESHDALVDLLEAIENILHRLHIYTKISPTTAMDEIIIKVLVELLSTLALVTDQITQGQPSESIFFTYKTLDWTLRSEIRKEAFGRETRRRGARENRPAQPTRGSENRGADSGGCVQSRPEYEGGHGQ